MQATQINHQRRTTGHHMRANQAPHRQLTSGKGMFEGMNGGFGIGSNGGIVGRHALTQSSDLNRTQHHVQGWWLSPTQLHPTPILKERALATNRLIKLRQ